MNGESGNQVGVRCVKPSVLGNWAPTDVGPGPEASLAGHSQVCKSVGNIQIGSIVRKVEVYGVYGNSEY